MTPMGMLSMLDLAMVRPVRTLSRPKTKGQPLS